MKRLFTTLLLMTSLLRLGAQEFRGAWLSTVAHDWPKIDVNANLDDMEVKAQIMAGQEEQKAVLISMLDSLKMVGCNAIFFQSVAYMDSMYPSEYLPWSRLLTGTEGQTPVYDPLEIVVNHCHELGMQIHLWMNPYRVGSKARNFADNHPMKAHPEWLQVYKGSYYWNPGNPEVRAFLGAIVREALTKYDLDGVHIDDYFYPSGLQKEAREWDDSREYAMYGDSLTIDEWRYRNVDATIETMYHAVHDTKPGAIFSVSPSGRLHNTDLLYADPRRWTGHLDLLIPQLYWQINHPMEDARFDKNCREWPEDNVSGVPVVIGMPIYRWGEKTGKAVFNEKEYIDEVFLTRSQPGVYGQTWFAARHLLEHFDFIRTNIYPDDEPCPLFGDEADAAAAGIISEE